jgi:Cdc6-like AAA superfamily ATPase
MEQKVVLLKIAIPENIDVYFDGDGIISKRIERLLNSIASGGKEVMAIIGGYGMGKTHTLKYIERLARARGFKAIYVQAPGRSFMELYASVAESLLNEVSKLRDYVSDPALRKALELLDDAENAIYVKGWLLGYSIPPKVRYKLGLIGSLREVNAVNFLVEMLRLVTSSGTSVIILLDEVEALLNLSKNFRYSYTEYLRELIDGMPRGAAVVMAMTPACWDELTTLNPALFRRLSGSILYLKPLKRDHVRKFLELYFSDLLSLLDDDVLDYIYELANGIQGEMLKYSSILLEEALYSGSNSKLSLDKVKQILSEYT